MTILIAAILEDFPLLAKTANGKRLGEIVNDIGVAS